VHAVRFVGNEQLISAGRDGVVRIWKLGARDASQVAELRDHRGWVLSLAVDKAGRFLASGGVDRMVRIWDLHSRQGSTPSTRKLVRTIGPDRSWVTALAFSADRKKLASTAGSGLTLWDVSSGKRLLRRRQHQRGLRALAIHKDTIATAGRDKTILLWRLPSLQIVGKLEGHRDAIFGLAFEPNGRRLVSAGRDGVRHWRMGVAQHGARLFGHRGVVERVAYGPMGRLLASGATDRTIRIWDARSGRQLEVLRGSKGAVRDVGFSPDGKLLVSASQSPTVPIWRLSDGQIVRELRGHRSGVRGAAFSPDGKWVATASSDRTARLWDVQSGAQLAVLSGHTHAIFGLAFHPSGKWLATASDDRSVRLWRLPSGTLERTFSGHRHRVVSVDFSPDGKTLASGDMRGDVRIWNIKSGAGRLLIHFAARVYWLAYAPTGRTLGVPLANGRAALVDLAQPARITWLRGHRRDVNAVRFSPDGRFAVTASDDRTIRRFRTADGAPTWKTPAKFGAKKRADVARRSGTSQKLAALESTFEQQPASRITQRLSGARDTLVAGFENGELGLWDVRSGRRLYRARLHGSVRHLLMRRGTLHAASELGDQLTLDLSVLERDYCELLRRIWQNVPLSWQDGHPLPTPTPRTHRCSRPPHPR
jgi:WD40 repeat protein